jgi:uncharacterized membrane protein YidH (DUF202 family)
VSGDADDDRPGSPFAAGLQHERTALAWERTSVAIMVAGIVLARYAARHGAAAVALVGILQVVVGGGVLTWSGRHYEDLHGTLRRGGSVVHPGAARLVGLSTVGFTGFALILALVLATT